MWFILLLCLTRGPVCTAQDESIGQDTYARTLEVLDIGYERPIEILAVRNLQKKEHWIRDLKIEIKNISGKPIYGVWFTIVMPDDKGPGGNPSAVDLQYGRVELLHPEERAHHDDKAIAPGETVVLRVVEQQGKGYEQHLKSANVSEAATQRVRAMIVAVSFGDGTGFINGGVPYPDAPPTRLRPQRYVGIPLDFK
jgi:hypothetical protein